MGVTTFVLVHGAWHGGWCWSAVSSRLRAAGHDVVAPTLSGLAERAGASSVDVRLADHVADVVATLGEAGPAVLVGHSYAGMVVTGAAAEVPDRVRHLVVVDGFLPEAGEPAVELLPPHAAAHYRRPDGAGADWLIPPRPLVNLGVTDPALVEAVTPRLTGHPPQTYLDASDHSASSLAVPGTYLLCAGWRSPFGRFAERARDLGWAVDELGADHEVPLTDPALLAERLEKVAS